MRWSAILAAIAVLHVLPLAASAAGVHPRFDVNDRRGGPFPSDRFTVDDASQNTGLRVNLPKPDCTVRPTDCQNLDVINTLDGFNVQPRLSIPFDGAIDFTSVSSDTVFLVRLGSTLPGGDSGGGAVIGINQIVWDVATTTLHVESDRILDQHTRYALIVTRSVRDAAGDPVEAAPAFRRFRHDLNFGQTGHDPVLKRYRKDLLDALAAAGVAEQDIAVASVFTTRSVTAVLEKIRDQIKLAMPASADFALGPGGTRAVYPVSSLTGITAFNQTGTARPRPVAPSGPEWTSPVPAPGSAAAMGPPPGPSGLSPWPFQSEKWSVPSTESNGGLDGFITRAGSAWDQKTQSRGGVGRNPWHPAFAVAGKEVRPAAAALTKASH